MMKKGRRMILDLESKIICGYYPAGSRIPSLRQLTGQFGVSMNTAHRGIEFLMRKGLLSVRHGSGTFVPEHREIAEHGKITIFSVQFSPEETSFTRLAFLGAAATLKKHGFQIRNEICGAGEIQDSSLEKHSEQSDGMILFGGYDANLNSPNLRCIAVGLGMHRNFGGIFSLVDLDPVRAAELAADYFYAKGKDQVVLITRNRANFQFRADLFRNLFRGEIIAEESEHVKEFNPEYGYLYLYGADALADAKEFRKNYQRNLSSCETVLCMDGKPMFSGNTELEIPTIAINWNQAGILAAEECIRRITHPGSAGRRIYISPERYENRIL